MSNLDSQRVERHTLIASEGEVTLPIRLGKRRDRRLKGESASELCSKNRGKVSDVFLGPNFSSLDSIAPKDNPLVDDLLKRSTKSLPFSFNPEIHTPRSIVSPVVDGSRPSEDGRLIKSCFSHFFTSFVPQQRPWGTAGEHCHPVTGPPPSASAPARGWPTPRAAPGLPPPPAPPAAPP